MSDTPERPTPETDAATDTAQSWVDAGLGTVLVVHRDFAKRLERQRDEAWAFESSISSALRRKDKTRPTKDEVLDRLAKLTAQRDRLLEALKDIMDEHVDRHDPSESASVARAAIAEVEGGR